MTIEGTAPLGSNQVENAPARVLPTDELEYESYMFNQQQNMLAQLLPTDEDNAYESYIFNQQQNVPAQLLPTNEEIEYDSYIHNQHQVQNVPSHVTNAPTEMSIRNNSSLPRSNDDFSNSVFKSMNHNELLANYQVQSKKESKLSPHPVTASTATELTDSESVTSISDHSSSSTLNNENKTRSYYPNGYPSEDEATDVIRLSRNRMSDDETTIRTSSEIGFIDQTMTSHEDLELPKLPERYQQFVPRETLPPPDSSPWYSDRAAPMGSQDTNYDSDEEYLTHDKLKSTISMPVHEAKVVKRASQIQSRNSTEV